MRREGGREEGRGKGGSKGERERERLLNFYNFFIISGCPEAIKVLVGNKADLSPEVDMTQVKVSQLLLTGTIGVQDSETVLVGFSNCNLIPY